MSYSQTWDLESIFPGGITSPQLTQKYELITSQTQDFATKVDAYRASDDKDFDQLANLADLAQTISAGIGTAGIFVNGWSSVDYGNSVYAPHFDKLGNLWVAFSTPLNRFQKTVITIR